jgi:urease accessory protein
MNPKKASRILALIGLSLFAGTASAHTGVHGTLAGFAGGLAHPLLGLDHLFAMIAIGLWAAQQAGRARWAIPAAFVGATIAGGMLAWSGAALPQAEGAIALSVLVLGLMVATRRRWAVTAGMARRLRCSTAAHDQCCTAGALCPGFVLATASCTARGSPAA